MSSKRTGRFAVRLQTINETRMTDSSLGNADIQNILDFWHLNSILFKQIKCNKEKVIFYFAFVQINGIQNH